MKKETTPAIVLIMLLVTVFSGPHAAARETSTSPSDPAWSLRVADIGYGAGPLDDAGWDIRLLSLQRSVLPRLVAEASAYRFFPNPFPAYWLALTVRTPLVQRTALTPSRRGEGMVSNKKSVSLFVEGAVLPVNEKGDGDFLETGFEFSNESGNTVKLRVSYVWISAQREGLAYVAGNQELVPVLSTGRWAGPRVALTVGFFRRGL